MMFFPILRGQWWLFLGACVSLAIALLHGVIVLIGPDAYSFFGGPGLARQAESGSWQPALMTLVLAWLFVVFTARPVRRVRHVRPVTTYHGKSPTFPVLTGHKAHRAQSYLWVSLRPALAGCPLLLSQC